MVRGLNLKEKKCILYYEANEGISQAFWAEKSTDQIGAYTWYPWPGINELWEAVGGGIGGDEVSLKLTESCENNHNERNNLGIPGQRKNLQKFTINWM